MSDPLTAAPDPLQTPTGRLQHANLTTTQAAWSSARSGAAHDWKPSAPAALARWWDTARFQLSSDIRALIQSPTAAGLEAADRVLSTLAACALEVARAKLSLDQGPFASISTSERQHLRTLVDDFWAVSDKMAIPVRAAVRTFGTAPTVAPAARLERARVDLVQAISTGRFRWAAHVLENDWPTEPLADETARASAWADVWAAAGTPMGPTDQEPLLRAILLGAAPGLAKDLADTAPRLMAALWSVCTAPIIQAILAPGRTGSEPTVTQRLVGDAPPPHRVQDLGALLAASTAQMTALLRRGVLTPDDLLDVAAYAPTEHSARLKAMRTTAMGLWASERPADTAAEDISRLWHGHPAGPMLVRCLLSVRPEALVRPASALMEVRAATAAPSLLWTRPSACSPPAPPQAARIAAWQHATAGWPAALAVLAHHIAWGVRLPASVNGRGGQGAVAAAIDWDAPIAPAAPVTARDIATAVSWAASADLTGVEAEVPSPLPRQAPPKAGTADRAAELVRTWLRSSDPGWALLGAAALGLKGALSDPRISPVARAALLQDAQQWCARTLGIGAPENERAAAAQHWAPDAPPAFDADLWHQRRPCSIDPLSNAHVLAQTHTHALTVWSRLAHNASLPDKAAHNAHTPTPLDAWICQWTVLRPSGGALFPNWGPSVRLWTRLIETGRAPRPSEAIIDAVTTRLGRLDEEGNRILLSWIGARAPTQSGAVRAARRM